MPPPRRPFGEQSEWLLPGNTAPETKGWIGERYDADAGLQYLNARYYDPELSLFLQPDWFEVTKAGVGTNRFSYSFNDPVNKFDPSGNKSMKEKNIEYNQRNKIGKYAYGDNDFERQRNGLHGRDFDWTKGSKSVKIGDVYLSAREYDAYTGAGGSIVFDGSVSQPGGARSVVTKLRIRGDFAKNTEVIQRIVSHPDFFDFVLTSLEDSRYLVRDKTVNREVVGHIYVSQEGKVRFDYLGILPGATHDSTPMPKPRPKAGETGVTFHTHPYNGGGPRLQTH